MLITGRKAKGGCNRAIVPGGEGLKRNCPFLPALCWLHAESWTLKFLLLLLYPPSAKMLASNGVDSVEFIQQGLAFPLNYHHVVSSICFS